MGGGVLVSLGNQRLWSRCQLATPPPSTPPTPLTPPPTRPNARAAHPPFRARAVPVLAPRARRRACRLRGRLAGRWWWGARVWRHCGVGASVWGAARAGAAQLDCSSRSSKRCRFTRQPATARPSTSGRTACPQPARTNTSGLADKAHACSYGICVRYSKNCGLRALADTAGSRRLVIPVVKRRQL